MMFALVPDDPFDEKILSAGNFIYFDNVRFIGGDKNLQLTDNSFEIWTSTVWEYTDQMHNVEALMKKSDDAYHGSFALKMSTQNVEWDEEDKELDTDASLNLWGELSYIRVGDDWEPRITGGIEFPERRDTLVFYYKYTHPQNVVDTAEVSLRFA